ncbi:hypothetical protein H4582DRAFT_1873334 [Lactarius indigo]|nr:hypothetical protein H4582DRAFT_1873334 [Lactarius indigo]
MPRRSRSRRSSRRGANHEAQPQDLVDETVETHCGDNPITQSSAENYGDPSGKLWSLYLTEAKREDGEIAKNWIKDTGGVLIFSGLFSAIVAAFIIESYKRLSPQSGDQMVALLAQLVSASNGAPPVVPETPLFEAPAYIVRVNVMWSLSLVLSLSCALLAMLVRQWARRYLDYTQHRSAPRRQARIRAYMFDGVEEFRLSQVVEAIPLLLHTSIFFFFAGLIDFIFPVNDTVALYITGCVAIVVSTYAILTLLPFWRLNSPYHTPLSVIPYISFRLSAFGLFLTAWAIEGIFRGLMVITWPWTTSTPWPTKLREILDEKVSAYRPRFFGSPRWRAELGAMEAPPSVDASALHWVLTTLNEDEEFEVFAARMPGFFDSRAVPDATSAMLSLMSDESTSEPILGARLRELLGTCLPGMSLLTEEKRTYRLHLCLISLWYCAREYNQPENSEVPLSSYVRAVFAGPEVIRWIRAERDLATRLLGRCFGSLIVKKLANNMTSPTRNGTATITADMACLPDILGATDEQVAGWLGQEGAIDLANVISLISGEIDTLATDGTKGVPSNVVDVFQQTLSTLADGIVSSHADVKWDTDQVARFHEMFSKCEASVPDMLKEPLRHMSEILLPSSYVEEAITEIPRSESDSED